MQVESALLFERPEEIYARVYRELRPRARTLEITVEFCRFANPDSFARLEGGALQIRISDLLAGAPAPIQEALAHILLNKLIGRPVPRVYSYRYRMYLNRQDMQRHIHLVRQMRGRKFISGPAGEHYDLEAIFERLNRTYFHGLMARPRLGWSRRPSRTALGHYDPSHNAIIISKLLDRAEVPAVAVDYVVYHEMLHLNSPVESRGSRRRVHTREFHQAERTFQGLQEAKAALKRL